MSNIFTEPVWGDPAEGLDVVTLPEKRDISPYELTGIIVRLLQYHFSSEYNIEEPLLKPYIWNSNDVTSKILIKPAFERNPQVRGKAAIYVSREDIAADHGGMLRGVTLHEGGTVRNDPDFGRHLTGSHVLICEGLTGAESEVIAWEAAKRMFIYSPAITKDFNLFAFDLKGLGKPTLRAEDRETGVWITPVIIGWQKLYRWRINNPEIY